MDEEDRPCNANLVTQLPNLPLLLLPFFHFFIFFLSLGQSLRPVFPSFTGFNIESPPAETENSTIKSPRLREKII